MIWILITASSLWCFQSFTINEPQQGWFHAFQCRRCYQVKFLKLIALMWVWIMRNTYTQISILFKIYIQEPSKCVVMWRGKSRMILYKLTNILDSFLKYILLCLMFSITLANSEIWSCLCKWSSFLKEQFVNKSVRFFYQKNAF